MSSSFLSSDVVLHWKLCLNFLVTKRVFLDSEPSDLTGTDNVLTLG